MVKISKIFFMLISILILNQTIFISSVQAENIIVDTFIQVLDPTNMTPNNVYIRFFLVVSLLIISLVVYMGFNTKCPSCKKWFSEKLDSKQEIGRHKSYKTVNEKTIHKNKKGEVTGSSEKKKDVEITLVEYRKFLKCKKCQYEWTTIVESEI